jgi:hypothetical protein
MRTPTFLVISLTVTAVLASAAEAKCYKAAVGMDALFIHATAKCNIDYMDTPAGYYALALARQCAGSLSQSEIRSVAKAAMLSFDRIEMERDNAAACLSVSNLREHVEQNIDK